MSERREPTANISGDDGEYFEPVPNSDPRTRAEAIIDRLGERYWRKSYGGQDAFTCLVRTILSQNTSDVASKPAFDALLDRFNESALAVELRDASRSEIAALIQPAGLYNQKAKVLQGAAERVITEFAGQSSFDRRITQAQPEEVRRLLLSFDGVGPKTADCVLLFSGGRDGVFPVDTHVHRIARRLGVAPPDADHEAVRETLERNIPPEKCGFGHTTMIQFGREYCTAARPACLDGPDACPLFDVCDRVGVDLDSGVVRDPAETEPAR